MYAIDINILKQVVRKLKIIIGSSSEQICLCMQKIVFIDAFVDSCWVVRISFKVKQCPRNQQDATGLEISSRVSSRILVSYLVTSIIKLL